MCHYHDIIIVPIRVASQENRPQTGVLKISDWAGYVHNFEAIWAPTWAEAAPRWVQVGAKLRYVGAKVGRSWSQVGLGWPKSTLSAADVADMWGRNGAFA